MEREREEDTYPVACLPHSIHPRALIISHPSYSPSLPLNKTKNPDLPKASYVIPARQAVFLSYGILCLCACETIVVYNIATWPSVRTFLYGSREARRRQAEIARATAAAARRRRAAANADRSMRGGVLGRASMMVRPGSGGSAGGGGGGLEGSLWGRVLDGAARARRLSASGSGGRPAFRAPAAAAVAMADARDAAQTAGDLEAAAPAGVSPPAKAKAGGGQQQVAFADAPLSSNGGGGGGGDSDAPSPLPRPTFLPHSDSNRSNRSTGGGGGGGGGDADDSAEATRLRALEADLDVWWWRHVAWCVDMGAFVMLGALYIIALLTIFASPYLNARRAKDRGLPDGSAWQAGHDGTAPGGLLMPVGA